LSKKPYITLGQLIDNEPFDVEIPGMGLAKIRYPTRGATIEAEKEVREEYSDVWNQLTDTERVNLITERLMLKILVHPKIPKEKLKNCKDAEIAYLLDNIAMYIGKPLKELLDKRSQVMGDFLELGKVGSR